MYTQLHAKSEFEIRNTVLNDSVNTVHTVTPRNLSFLERSLGGC
jgi:hypothetical protein